MYLLVIALGLLLIWLVSEGFANSERKKIAKAIKNLKWVAISAFFLLLGLWFIFSGKFYFSWVAILGFLPLLKRLLFGAIYLWGANMMRKAFSPMGLLSRRVVKISLAQAENLLDISHKDSETKIVDAYLAAKKQANQELKHAPDLYKNKLMELAAARDVIIDAKKS